MPRPNFRACSGERVSQLRRVRSWTRVFFLRSALFVALALTVGNEAARAQAVSHEYQIKAVFLFNFAQFNDWPTNAFTKPDAPFVIGILGSDPFGSLIDDAVRNEQANGHKLVVQRFARLEDVKNCQLLFISQSEVRHLDKIVAGLKGKPILTVSEIDNSAHRGVCVRMHMEKNKIKLRINTDSLKEAHLTMSSQLLRVAEIVSKTKN